MRFLELALLLGALLAVLCLAPAAARTPANSVYLPQEKEVWAPGPRNRFGPPRITVYKNAEARAWVSAIFSRIASAANLPVMPKPTDDEQRERDRREDAGLPDQDNETVRRGRGHERQGGKAAKGSSVTVLDWDIVNAFATPGEKMYVTTGLLDLVESDDELAAVIGHEISHVRLNHIEKRAKRQMISSLLMAAATMRAGPEAFIAGQAMSSVPINPYGQRQELEADMQGLEYMRAAGYDPNGMLSFLEKLAGTEDKKDQQRGVASLFNTHPPTPERIERIRSRLKQLGLPLAKPTHLTYDYKYDHLGIDLSHLSYQSLTGRQVAPLSDKPGRTVTKIEVHGNLVPDGDFEGPVGDDGLPAGWTVLAGEASVEERDPQSGKACLRISPTGGSAEVESPPIDVDAEQDYLLSGYIRSGDIHERLSLGLRYLDEKKKVIRTDYPAAWKVFAPGTWTRYQGIVFAAGNKFSLPPGVRWVKVVAAGTYTKASSSWFDDLLLLKVRK